MQALYFLSNFLNFLFTCIFEASTVIQYTNTAHRLQTALAKPGAKFFAYPKTVPKQSQLLTDSLYT